MGESPWRWCSLSLAISLLLCLIHPGGQQIKQSPSIPTSLPSSSSSRHHYIRGFNRVQANPPPPSPTLEYDFYRDKCPKAEAIVRSMTSLLYLQNASVAPALLRLVFHDCVIQGCDASVLLRPINGSLSERDAIPNETLKGFDAVDAIKSKLEDACPATVSCADVLVLAARDAVVLSGGPFYPVLTGRRDSDRAFFDEAQHQIPTPSDNYTKTLATFAARGFTERDTVALLGAHSVGMVHCRFFKDRLGNFSGVGEPDGSIDSDRLEQMRRICESGDQAGLEMGFGPETPRGKTGRFDSHYYKELLQGRGILFADQQLTAGRTVRWVSTYADKDGGTRAFRADFARAMAKLSGLGPLVGPMGQVRRICSQLVA